MAVYSSLDQVKARDLLLALSDLVGLGGAKVTEATAAFGAPYFGEAEVALVTVDLHMDLATYGRLYEAVFKNSEK